MARKQTPISKAERNTIAKDRARRVQKLVRAVRTNTVANKKASALPIAMVKKTQSRIEAGHLGMQGMPVWVCFGPDFKPRSVHLSRPDNAEAWALKGDGDSAFFGRISLPDDQRKAERLGYWLVEMRAHRPGGRYAGGLAKSGIKPGKA